MPNRSFLTVDGFAPQATALRDHFEERFADPRSTRGDRFVWDLWNVPGQYTALRTPAWQYFPKKTYDAFHQHLVWWGRRTLGCHDVSPPWMSCYVNGCEQRLHGDLPHGQFAFVFSLTPWEQRTFRGGETLLLRDEVLELWSDFASTRGVEEPDVLAEIPARFNRLTVFDPRIPHGVRRVDGSMDPREGRLVIHGWFVQPRPFIEGPLSTREFSESVAELSETLAPHLSEGLPLAGFVSLRFQVTKAGKVGKLQVLADTTRVPAAMEPDRKRLLRAVTQCVSKFTFRAQRGVSWVTLPVVFER